MDAMAFFSAFLTLAVDCGVISINARIKSSADGCQALRSNEAQVSEHIRPALLQVARQYRGRTHRNGTGFDSNSSCVYLLPQKGPAAQGVELVPELTHTPSAFFSRPLQQLSGPQDLPSQPPPHSGPVHSQAQYSPVHSTGRGAALP